MIRPAAMLGAIVAIIVLVIAYPYLPGGHDPLAVPLSTMLQALGVLGLPMVVVGLAWLGHECWRWSRIRRGTTAARHPRLVASAVLVGASVAIVGTSLLASAMVGGMLTILVLAGWVVLGVVGARRPGPVDAPGLDPRPVYLIVVPIAALVAGLGLMVPLTSASRDRAMAASAPLIADIEAFHDANRHYPESLDTVYTDYGANVVGIGGFRYARRGDSYQVSFEQPRFLLDDIGAREFVVYEPRGDPAYVSHDSWVLLLPPTRLLATPGWYETTTTSRPGWRTFLFD